MKLNPFSPKDISVIKRTYGYVKPYRFRYFLAFLCVLSSIGFGLAQPLIWGNLLGSLFKKDYSSLLTMVKLMVGFFVLSRGMEFLHSYLFSTLNQKMIFDIKRDMFTKIINLPIKAFDEMRVGEFMSRLNNDASVISNVITGQFLSSVINVLRVIIIGIAMFTINIKLSLVVLIAFPISFVIFLVFGKILRKKNEEIAKLNDSYFSNIQESMLGIREVNCLGIKKNKIAAFLYLSEKLKDKGIRIGILNSITGLFSGSVRFATEITGIVMGFFLITQGRLTVEMYIAFSAYAAQFTNSLMELTQMNSNIQQALVSITRVFEIIDNLSYSTQKFGHTELKTVAGDIRFEEISFNYNDDLKVLRGISFHIKPNRKVAFVGSSGVGKTTLFNLLLRFYDPTGGSIKIDGINIEELTEDSLRKHISVVRQDPFLFNMSIKENLLLSNPEATPGELVEACKVAYIHDHIVAMPMGYDAIVGERGVNFSGGERHRRAIARAILRKSEIILFDEATSALDNESQYAVKKAVDKLVLNHTVIIIAHRLFTVIDADEIVVMEDGKIVGVGTHDELMRSNYIYNKLYKTEVDAINQSQVGLG